MIVVTVVGVLCGWVGIFLQRVWHQRQVVAKMQALGWKVYFDYQYDGESLPPGPSIVRWILGDDAFAYVEFTEGNHAKDKDLILLRELPRIKRVDLDGPGITDEGLKTVIESSEYSKT